MHAWGRKTLFNKDDKNTYFIYLGTESISTCSVLLENGIIPDDLVLQYHGLSHFWVDEGMALFNTFKSNLPKYVLMDPEGAVNIPIWANCYTQITQPFLPKVYQSLPQNKNPRALFINKSFKQ
jgi:hypothetical protein